MTLNQALRCLEDSEVKLTELLDKFKIFISDQLMEKEKLQIVKNLFVNLTLDELTETEAKYKNRIGYMPVE